MATRKIINNVIIPRKKTKKQPPAGGRLKNTLYAAQKKLTEVVGAVKSKFSPVDGKIIGNSNIKLKICYIQQKKIEQQMNIMENLLKVIEYFMTTSVYEPCKKMIQIATANTIEEGKFYDEMTKKLGEVRNEFTLKVFGSGASFFGPNMIGKKRNIFNIKDNCQLIPLTDKLTFSKVGFIECRIYDLRNCEIELNKAFRRYRDALAYINSFDTYGKIVQLNKRIIEEGDDVKYDSKTRSIMELVKQRMDIYNEFKEKINDVSKIFEEQKQIYKNLAARVEALGFDSMVDYEPIDLGILRDSFSTDDAIADMQIKKLRGDITSFVSSAYIAINKLDRIFKKEENIKHMNILFHHAGEYRKLFKGKKIEINKSQFIIDGKQVGPDDDMEMRIKYLYYTYYKNFLKILKFCAFSPKLIVMRDMGAFTIAKLNRATEKNKLNLLFMTAPFVNKTLLTLYEENKDMYISVREYFEHKDSATSILDDSYFPRLQGAREKRSQPSSQNQTPIPLMLLTNIVIGNANSYEESIENTPSLLCDIHDILLSRNNNLGYSSEFTGKDFEDTDVVKLIKRGKTGASGTERKKQYNPSYKDELTKRKLLLNKIFTNKNIVEKKDVNSVQKNYIPKTHGNLFEGDSYLIKIRKDFTEYKKETKGNAREKLNIIENSLYHVVCLEYIFNTLKYKLCIWNYIDSLHRLYGEQNIISVNELFRLIGVNEGFYNEDYEINDLGNKMDIGIGNIVKNMFRLNDHISQDKKNIIDRINEILKKYNINMVDYDYLTDSRSYNELIGEIEGEIEGENKIDDEDEKKEVLNLIDVIRFSTYPEDEGIADPEKIIANIKIILRRNKIEQEKIDKHTYDFMADDSSNFLDQVEAELQDQDKELYKKYRRIINEIYNRRREPSTNQEDELNGVSSRYMIGNRGYSRYIGGAMPYECEAKVMEVYNKQIKTKKDKLIAQLGIMVPFEIVDDKDIITFIKALRCYDTKHDTEYHSRFTNILMDKYNKEKLDDTKKKTRKYIAMERINEKPYTKETRQYLSIEPPEFGSDNFPFNKNLGENEYDYLIKLRNYDSIWGTKFVTHYYNINSLDERTIKKYKDSLYSAHESMVGGQQEDKNANIPPLLNKEAIEALGLAT